MKNHFNLAYHSTQNHQKFVAGIQKLIGQIPPQGEPAKVSFLHIDTNNAEAEIGAPDVSRSHTESRFSDNFRKN